MVRKITLTKRDSPEQELSTGTSITLFSDDLIDTKTFRACLKEVIKDDIDIRISPAELIVDYRWK